MNRWSRREFLQHGSAALIGLMFPVLPRLNLSALPNSPPTSFGRIATWWAQSVHRHPSAETTVVARKGRDEVIPLYAAVAGVPPWPSNRTWYRTDGGFIHSGYVQPVEWDLQRQVVTEVSEAGFWGQVSVPYARACSRPGSSHVSNRLYYGTVYRVVRAEQDGRGRWWYQLAEGYAYGPGAYVPAWSLRRIDSTTVLPIPARNFGEKWIEIDLTKQWMTCFEGETVVFETPVSSGVGGLTPRGEYRVLAKRHAQRMVGADYDLPGVPFPVYFTPSGIAIHGTYWHNDYGRPHSHGCINVPDAAAQWVFRWTEPTMPYDLHTLQASRGEGTRVVVV
ncbi:MAG: L,D-transpeptidase [Anaerolineae bacterium]|nr:L,D-transpeptidase [Anaerolineae bacterium]